MLIAIPCSLPGRVANHLPHLYQQTVHAGGLVTIQAEWTQIIFMDSLRPYSHYSPIIPHKAAWTPGVEFVIGTVFATEALHSAADSGEDQQGDEAYCNRLDTHSNFAM